MKDESGTLTREQEIDAAIAAMSIDEHQHILHREGAADLNAEMAEIGLSSRSGWYASVLLYGAGGITAVLAHLLWPEAINAGIGYLGGVAILLSLLSVVGARYWVNDDWATHLRLTCGLGIFLAGIFVAGDARVAFTMMPLFVLITPTFLYGARFALPYVSLVVPAMFITVMITPGAAQFAHAVITSGAMLLITVSFMLAERRTRQIARANRRMAYTDPLTGIANTRRLRETLSGALASREKFALFALDLDNFKLVNDTFDHTTGDTVLRAVAAGLGSEIGPGDIVARRGGDEFSVLVAHADAVDLRRMADRLARAIERARLATCPQISPSGSVAYVTSTADDSISSILQRADDALHEAKRAFHAGRSNLPEDGVVSDELAAAAVREQIDREQAMRSVSKAVSRAYDRSRGTPLQDHVSQLARRARRFSMTGDSLWGLTAMMLAPVGLAITLFTLFGGLDPLPLAVGLTVGVALLVLSGLTLDAAARHTRHTAMLWILLVSIALVSVAMAFAGPAGVALLDIYVVFALLGFYVLRAAKAIVGLVACCVAFLAFSMIGEFPDAAIRSGVTISVMIVGSVIVNRVRSVTLGFVRTNRELSEVDALTGVANLRALQLRVDSVIEKAGDEGRRGKPMIMTVDLDRFKLVNDRYNHTVGDQMLEAVARAISECVRIDEMVARRGGDEFFVLFSASSAEHVESVMPRVREAVEHARRRICPDLTPTASIGCVEWRPGQSAAEFLAAADAIMHDEKIETRARGYAQAQPV